MIRNFLLNNYIIPDKFHYQNHPLLNLNNYNLKSQGITHFLRKHNHQYFLRFVHPRPIVQQFDYKLIYYLNLEVLDLGDNRIRKIENIENLVNLRELHLAKNKIQVIENIGHLKKLYMLTIQANFIEEISGLDDLP